MAKSGYTGSIRHFTLDEVDGKKVNIGIANIKESQSPIDAAKKLLSSYCRDKNIKSNQRNKVNISFTIRETTRGHSKIYGPYKGYFVKYDKPVIIKLKNGKVIKKTLKPIVKLDDSIQKGGWQCNTNVLITEEELRDLLKLLNRSMSEKYTEEEITFMGKFKQLKCSNPTSKGILDNINTSSIEDMSYLFEDFDFENYCVFDRTFDISKWDVSNVKNMSYMFKNCKGFNQNLSEWKLNSIENMSYMFSDISMPEKWSLNWVIPKQPEQPEEPKQPKLKNMFYKNTNLFQLVPNTLFAQAHYKLRDNVIIKFTNNNDREEQYKPKYNLNWSLYNPNYKLNVD